MSEADEIKQAIAKATESRASIERALAPSRAMADLVRAIQSPLHDVHIAQIAKAMRPPAHLTAVAQMMIAVERDHKRFAELARPPRIVDDVMKQMARMREISESITGQFRAIQEKLRFQASVFEELSARFARLDDLKLSIPQFSQTALVWNVATIGLLNRMKDIGLLARREMLSTRLFEAASAYGTFVRHTIERLAAHPAPDVAVRLRGSLNLAEHQLLNITDTINDVIVLPDDEDQPDEVRVLDAPLAQQCEMLACEVVEEETDIEALTIVSPTARTVQMSRCVLNLVVQCNEAAKTSAYGEEIFKPTTRLIVYTTSSTRLRARTSCGSSISTAAP